jgi:hypothetical protein
MGLLPCDFWYSLAHGIVIIVYIIDFFNSSNFIIRNSSTKRCQANFSISSVFVRVCPWQKNLFLCSFIMTAEPSPGNDEKSNGIPQEGQAVPAPYIRTYDGPGKSCICRELASPVPQFGYFHSSQEYH